MADLFISHSSVDVEWTRDLRRQLEAAGYTCWMAPDDVNGPVPWAEQILEAIESCRVMVIVISHAANQSAHVSKEVGAALEHNKPLLPIRTEDVIPTGSLNYLLQLVQWIDAFPGSIADHLDRIRRAVAYSIPASAMPGPTVSAGPTAWPTDSGPTASLTPPPPFSPPAPPSYVAPPAILAPPPAYAAPVSPSAPTAVYPTPRASGRGTPSTPVLLAAAGGLVVAIVLVLVGVNALGQRPTFPPPTSPATFGGVAFTASPSAAIETHTEAPTETATETATDEPTPTETATEEPTPTEAPTEAPTSTPIADLTALIPTSVDGIDLTVSMVPTDTAFGGSDAGTAAMRGFISSVGKQPDDLQIAQAISSGGTTQLAIYALYLPGIDSSQLEQALISTAFASTPGSESRPATISGKDVTVVTSTQQPTTLYIYRDGDVVYSVEAENAGVGAGAIATTPVS
jgi:hypothetical protein